MRALEKYPFAEGLVKTFGYSSYNIETERQARYRRAKVVRPGRYSSQQSTGSSERREEKKWCGVKDDEDALKWLGQGGWLGAVIGKGFVVVDMDDEYQGSVVLGMLRVQGLKFTAIKTPHGYQFIFKDTGRVKKQATLQQTRLGVRVDYRLAGLGYIILPTKGLEPERAFIGNVEAEPSGMPQFLLPVQKETERNRIVLPVEQGKVKRHEVLLSQCGRLKVFGAEKAEALESLLLLNQYFVVPPKPVEEIESVVQWWYELQDSAKEIIPAALRETGDETVSGKEMTGQDSAGTALVNRADDNHAEGNRVESGERKPVGVSDRAMSLMQVEAALSERYAFRRNVVTAKVEFHRHGEEKFRVMQDAHFNSICRELAHQGLPVHRVAMLLQSDFTPEFNPFLEYFEKAITNDELQIMNEENEASAIEAMADMVTVKAVEGETDMQSVWRSAFKRWFVAMVGSAMCERVINHTMLVLVGQQGKGKTSFVSWLVPEELSDYYYSGVINPDNKDTLAMLSEKLLINCDELEILSRQEVGSLKAMLTQSTVAYRRAYGRFSEVHPHRASFAGSINHEQFLSDTTGSRRFLCFEVEAVDLEKMKRFEKRAAYCEAVKLFRSGFRYWFEGEEIARLSGRNERYNAVSAEEDFVLKHLRPARDEAGAEFMSAGEVGNFLTEKYKGVRMNMMTIGRVMKKHGYERVKKQGRYGYWVNMGRGESVTENLPPNF